MGLGCHMCCQALDRLRRIPHGDPAANVAEHLHIVVVITEGNCILRTEACLGHQSFDTGGLGALCWKHIHRIAMPTDKMKLIEAATISFLLLLRAE
ncbi:hypothetical protein D1872_301090 [compost metagenome]